MDGQTLERFLAKIEYIGDCWLWTGATTGGYARLMVGSRKDGTRRVAVASRLSYEHFVGPIPSERPQLDHVLARGCTSRSCVNPAHLEPVTNAENSQRGRRGRLVTICVNGHPYNEANTMRRRNGRRGCRACARERMRAKRAAGYIAPSRR